jgi:xanthine dehydrogenase YagR molybdenum-binding subunit
MQSPHQSTPDGSSNAAIGKPLNRVDGRLKVTGAAPYAAEFPQQNLAHAVLVQSTIARGQIQSIDISAAEAAPGVLAVLTHLNLPQIPQAATSAIDNQQSLPSGGAGETSSPSGGEAAPFAVSNPVLKDGTIHFYGQHVGVVIAETFEQARYAARLVRVTYRPETAAIVLEEHLATAYKPAKLLIPLEPDSGRGDVDRGLREAEVRLEANYSTPVEHHNPLEPHATIAVWAGDRLTLYDASQSVNSAQQTVAATLQIPPENVQVISRFVGGGFGGKFSTWGHTILAAIAAKQVQRPVKLVLMRQQMFTSVGCRPHSLQRIRLGAMRDGKLTALTQEITTQTSISKEFVEHVGAATNMIYNATNTRVTHRAVPLNMVTPTIMRAPGETPGMFALESAMDELAYELGIDPVELRIRNDPPQDPEKNLPWSSRSLVQCLQMGAEQFGWAQRNPQPRSMRDGRDLVGYGVASATYPTNRLPSSARTQILADGQVLVQIAATDLGTGTYTILTQIAADAIGVSVEQVRVEMGDTKLPRSPGSGGSWGAASYGSAVQASAQAARAKIFALVREDARSPLRGLSEAQMEVRDGRVVSIADSNQGETYQEILTRNSLPNISADINSQPGTEAQKYSMHAFGAQFAEVRVDPDVGMVRVSRFLGVFGVGRVLNQKTARSQLSGGMIWGIGQALHEEAVMDDRYGHFVNHNLGEYHIPVNADVPAIEVLFVDETDPHVNPLGVKGVGEIGIVGAGAAVANAVYHATGKRIRELPITPDKLL